MNQAHTPGRRAGKAVAVVLVLALGLTGCSVSSGSKQHHGSGGSGGTPPLYPQAQASSVDAVIDPQAAKAKALMAEWWKVRGTHKNDKKFVHWLEAHAPAPPSEDVRRGELAELEQLAANRDSDGVAAASWLNDNGNGAAWVGLAKAANLPGKHSKQTVADLLAMTDKVSGDLKDSFQQSSPYVLEPSLRTDKHVKKHDVCPCSYPSTHATATAAATTFLSKLVPAKAGQYKRFRDQVDYSRLYIAGHVRSDLVAGTFLGDAIGEYFLVTRQGVSLS